MVLVLEEVQPHQLLGYTNLHVFVPFKQCTAYGVVWLYIMYSYVHMWVVEWVQCDIVLQPPFTLSLSLSHILWGVQGSKRAYLHATQKAIKLHKCTKQTLERNEQVAFCGEMLPRAWLNQISLTGPPAKPTDSREALKGINGHVKEVKE